MKAFQPRLISLIFSGWIGVCSALSSPPLFTLNTSEAPLNRWDGALGLIAAKSSFEESWYHVFNQHNNTLFQSLNESAWDQMGISLSTYFPDQAEELKGLSSQFMSVYGEYVSYEYLAGWVYFHELAHSDLALGNSVTRAECTAILCQNEAGNIIHGANMDQSPQFARLVTLDVRFVNAKGDLIFEGVDWYWFTTGVTRAVMANVISLQENWRSSPTPIPVSDVMKGITTGSFTPQVFVFRQFMESLVATQGIDFNDAIDHMANIPLGAPFYVMLAGVNPGEGVIITRNETGVDGPASSNGGSILDNIPRLNSQGRSTLVQTNYDWWKEDSPTDPRRTSAEDMLAQIANSGDERYDVGIMKQTLYVFGVISSFPVHNPHTVFTAMMSAGQSDAEGLMTAYVRVSMCPQHNKGNAYLAARYCPHLLDIV